MTVFGRPSSINVQKVLWALEEAGVPFKVQFASAMMGPGDTPSRHAGKPSHPVTQTEDYLEMNPAGLIPTLVVHGAGLGDKGADSVALSESNSIVRYVARRFGLDAQDRAGAVEPAEVAPETQALREAWMDRQTSAGPDLNPVYRMIDETSRKEAAERSPENLRQAMRDWSRSKTAQMIEKQLTSTDFLAGDSFSMADIPIGAVACRVYVAREASERMGVWAGVEESERPPATPALDAWFERLLSRDAFRRGAYDPERLHSGLPPTRPLPEWHRQYLEANGLEIPARVR